MGHLDCPLQLFNCCFLEFLGFVIPKARKTFSTSVWIWAFWNNCLCLSKPGSWVAVNFWRFSKRCSGILDKLESSSNGHFFLTLRPQSTNFHVVDMCLNRLVGVACWELVLAKGGENSRSVSLCESCTDLRFPPPFICEPWWLFCSTTLTWPLSRSISFITSPASWMFVLMNRHAHV